MAHHVFKIVVEQIDSTETIILKHFVDLVYPCFHQFNEKIFQRFPKLRDTNMKMYWIDSENDHITIYNEEDFHYYMESNPGKLYIDAKTGKAPADLEPPTKKTVQFNDSLAAPQSVPTSPSPSPPPSAAAGAPAAESLNQNIPRSSSSPSSPQWPNVVCDGCDKGIYGFRYKCIQCYNYDLCADCERKVHTHHSMLRLAEPMDISKLERIFSKVMRHGHRHSFNREPPMHEDRRIFCGVVPEFRPAAEHHSAGKHSDRKHRRCSNRNVNANEFCNVTGRTCKSAAAGTSNESTSAGNEQPKAPSTSGPKVHVFNFPRNTGSAAGGIDVNFPKVAEDCAKFTNTILSTLADIIDPYFTGTANAKPTTTTTTTNSQGPTTTTTTTTTSNSNATNVPENVGNTVTTSQATTTNTSTFTTTATSSSASTTNNIPKHIDYFSDGIRVTATDHTDENMALIEDCADDIGSDSDNRYSPMQCTDWLLIDREPEASTSATAQSTTTTTTTTASNNNNNNVGVSVSDGKAPSDAPSVSELPNYRRMARELEMFISSENGDCTIVPTSGTSTSTSTAAAAATATREAGRPSAQTETTPMHPNKKINDALVEMTSMGFSNEGAWLTKLLETVDGNISEALDLLHPNYS